MVVVFLQVKNAQDLESWNGHCLVYFEWIYVFTSFIDRYMITDILG